MGLVQKQTQTITKPLYTLGMSKTLLVVGLGNPGKKYAKNRHNIGFMAVDEFARLREMGQWHSKKPLHADIIEQNFGDKKLLLAKPNTFMNDSGRAVNAIMHFYEVAGADVLVIHDELDIAFGKIRLAGSGGDAGHNGLKSIIAQIGKDFGRVRVGIGPKKPAAIDSADFVLKDFPRAKTKEVQAVIKEVCAVIDEWLASGKLEAETRRVVDF